ncbi:LMBR1 domain-containing protein 2 homolog [Harpegnathos saltator]|uniref:LMBR1 domain-containing protein 2-like protein n=1 Tax=Harpegnathos saltator TaxID=610380 RepID=E2BPT8_HARSA|nr:LMBR1 domain-containing protein 2 homolog [Harpegnathos saltator]EFN82289.1 LMBR1 domain-containing protein 2-like protein [Harpegnathos saltator]
MVLGIFLTEIIVAFLLAGTLLFKYGNVFRHHIIVTVSVLIAWYFSLLIIFILPLDVSSTVFRQCVEQNIHNSTKSPANTTSVPFATCKEPWPNVPESVFPNLWRIVYWTSQCLTWLILPLMQSYIKAGDFTVRGKLKSALIDNAIYYGSYLFICGILLIYIALKPGLDFDGQKLKVIASSASNTWGLFLLVLLLGYALVEVPRGLWNASKPGYTLSYSYFKVAKLSLDKCEAEETVDDILESLQIATISIGPGHPFHCNLETIFQKIPAELKDRMNRRQLPDDTPTDTPTEKSLIRLHRQTIKALQTLQRIETQWGILVDKIFDLEDVAKNQVSHDRRFKQAFPTHRSLPFRIIYNPVIEWYWKCVVKNYVLKMAAICAGCLSVAVVWSEVTFFNKSPVLSLFAQFLKLAKRNYDYFTIEVLSMLIIAYLCYCAYSTVLKIRVLNLYYLAPHHQTNEYSLIFSGMMLCRLTPPMCLNFLGLIHMDSHIIKTHILETHYTQVMGHMDVIPIISDGFNVYFPIAILAFCLATYFSIGSRLLSMLGFQQFLDDDEFTTDLVEEGRELIKRERRKRQRAEDSMYRRREMQERFNISVGTSRYRTSRQSTDTVRPLKRDESIESARAGLLRDFDPTEYCIGMTFDGDGYVANNRYDGENQGDDSYDSHANNARAFSTSTSRVGPPPRGLFDDI